MTALRILFMGTPAFAVPSLQRLVESQHNVVGVVTQPDRPRGRGRHVVPQAVKAAATERGLVVLQPTRLADTETIESLRALEPDLAVVAAYGRLLSQVLLDLPRLGVINVHASLLPRWRGAAPVHRAIVAGDTESGVTIMRVILALDAGPMLARVTTPIDPKDTSVDLEARLATLGADALIGVVDRLAAGPVREDPQDDAAVTYAKRLERADSRIDWVRPALAVHNQIRGLQPWPLATATLNGRRLALLRAAVADERPQAQPPGTVVAVERDAIVVAAGPGAIRLLELREENRAAMSVSAYLNGRRVAIGDRFEPDLATS